MPQNLAALRRAFETAGIVFIDENGGGRGVRFSVPTEETPAVEGNDGDGTEE